MEKLNKLLELVNNADDELRKFPKNCEYNDLLCDLYSSLHDIKYIADDIQNNYTLQKLEKKFTEYQEIKYQYEFSGYWFKGIIENVNDDDTYDIRPMEINEVVHNIESCHIKVH